MEVTHRQVRAPNNTHIGDTLTILIECLYSSNDIVQMLLGQTAAVDGETYHVGYLCLLLGRLEVVLHGVVTQLGGADTVAADQLDREALTGKGVVTALAIEELIHIDIDGMAASGQHHAIMSRPDMPP